MHPDREAVFWSRVAKGDDCWLWTGKLNDGYGYFECPDRKRTIKAHKVAYELTYGPVAKGLVVDHTCRNRARVRPDHCRVVTGRVNTLENSLAVTAINAAKIHCPKGHPYIPPHLEVINGARHCRTCRRAWERERRKRQRAAPSPPVQVKTDSHVCGYDWLEDGSYGCAKCAPPEVTR